MIVLKHNPMLLGVNHFYQILVEKLDKLEQLGNTRCHPLSAEIICDRKRQLVMSDSIVMQAQSVEKAKLDCTLDTAFLLIPLIKNYLVNLIRKISKVVDK